MSIREILSETLYLGEKPGPIKEVEFKAFPDLMVRVGKDKIQVHYLYTTDQIIIPSSYLDLFTRLDRTSGDIIKNSRPKDNAENLVSLGIYLPNLLYGKDHRGLRDILGKMVKNGTKEIREILPSLEPWTLRNIHNTLEI